MRVLRILLIPLVPIAVVGWLVAAISAGVHPLFIMGMIPILALSALMAANVLSAPNGRGDEPPPQSYPQTEWKLIDPQLSTWGIWRADLRVPPHVDKRSGDNRPSEEYVRRLIRDWSLRGGYPFQGLCADGHSLRIDRVDPTRVGLEPSGSDGQAIYCRITWEVVEWGEPGRRWRWSGWLRLGQDYAEFRLETDGQGRTAPSMSDDEDATIAQDSLKSDRAEVAGDSGPAQLFSGQHPLWDQSLDG
jgi:hypothetical protein